MIWHRLDPDGERVDSDWRCGFGLVTVRTRSVDSDSDSDSPGLGVDIGCGP